MEFSLYPFNYYVLYFSIGLLLVFMVLTVKKLLTIPKTLAESKPLLDVISNQAKLASLKTEAMNEKKKETEKYTKILAAAAPVLLAVVSIYKKNDDYKGVNGMVQAVKAYIRNDSAEKKLIRRIRKSI